MDVFAALSDATRRAILERLTERERTVGELVEAFPRLCQPTVSHHLRTLREAGLVDVRRDGHHRIYSFKPEGLAEVEGWLARCRDGARAPREATATTGRTRKEEAT